MPVTVPPSLRDSRPGQPASLSCQCIFRCIMITRDVTVRHWRDGPSAPSQPGGIERLTCLFSPVVSPRPGRFIRVVRQGPARAALKRLGRSESYCTSGTTGPGPSTGVRGGPAALSREPTTGIVAPSRPVSADRDRSSRRAVLDHVRESLRPGPFTAAGHHDRPHGPAGGPAVARPQ